MEPEARESQEVVRVGIGETPGGLDPGFKDEVTAQQGRLDIALCYQCGVCSASCPTIDRMEYGPRRIMHMIHLGMTDKVLSSRDIWFCVSCYSCSARCPQGVEIADVMSRLRSLAMAKGLAKDKEATFSRVFVEVLRRYGRMYEPEVILRYFAAEASLGAILRMAPVGLSMFRRGKIALRPERIENAKELAEMIAACSPGEEEL